MNSDVGALVSLKWTDRRSRHVLRRWLADQVTWSVDTPLSLGALVSSYVGPMPRYSHVADPV